MGGRGSNDRWKLWHRQCGLYFLQLVMVMVFYGSLLDGWYRRMNPLVVFNLTRNIFSYLYAAKAKGFVMKSMVASVKKIAFDIILLSGFVLGVVAFAIHGW
jgi:hypothetical protein